jgi:aminoglycoside 3-N-acetyltransferase I
MQSIYTCLRLRAEDITLLKQLRNVYATVFAEQEKYVPSPSDDYLNSILSDKHCVHVVAISPDDRVIGGLSAYILPKIEQKVSEIYLYDLAVLEEHRRRGVATRLIEELKNSGADVGAKVIFVQADNVDSPAVALYEKLCESKETDISHFDIRI